MSNSELYHLAQSQLQQPSNLKIKTQSDGIQLTYGYHRIALIQTDGTVKNYDPAAIRYDYPRPVQGEIRNVIINIVLAVQTHNNKEVNHD